MTKRALVFDPYLDTLGGGERYVLTVAKFLTQSGYQVSLAWPSQKILESATFRFGLDLKNITADFGAFELFKSSGQLLKKIEVTKKYDLVFFLSDGSIPFLFGKKNIIHFQVPFKKIINPRNLNFVKFKLINKFVYNSKFTQGVLEKNLPKKGVVIYPPIDTKGFKPNKAKENIILAVGRFDSPSHAKRQDILIEAFGKLNQETNGKYKLILAGGLRGSDRELLSLKSRARNLPIEFKVSPSFKELVSLYAKAKIFWHAAGFSVNEQENPDKVEHFGMTTVEAMSAGCVPIVCNKGGQKEIIEFGTGYLWNTIPELVNQTLQIIKSPDLVKEISKNAIKRSKGFGLKTFEESLKKIV
jgi:glycosyltransferase involved in cell wall biosynthesis